VRAGKQAPPLQTLLLLVVTATVAVAQDARPAPFFDARQYQSEYVGPGREVPEPTDVSEVRLAYFGPADASHPDWGDAWRGASLAVEQANAEGGYQGRPFRLLAAWSDNPWGSGVADLAKLIFAQGVWAVVGGVDGVTTHLAEQIVVKAHLALVSPGSTDESVHLTNVPWAFSLLPSDDWTAPLLVRALELTSARGTSPSRLVVVTATDHDSHVTWLDANEAWVQGGRPAPILHVDVATGAPELSRLTAEVEAARPAAVLVVAQARNAGRLVRALRTAGVVCPILAGPTAGRRAFVLEAGPAAEGVVFPALRAPGTAPAFERDYGSRYGGAPDYLAAASYDAVRLVVAAVRQAGLNRVRIRDAIQALGPPARDGAQAAWDPTGRNARPVRLATWRNGRLAVRDDVEPLSRDGGGLTSVAGAHRAR
jgi:branched-chain amino acid transport system substrate-binding protein